MSRARGAKAHHQTMQQIQLENTINFSKVTNIRTKHIELIPKSKNQEQYILNLNDHNQHIVVAVGPAGTGKTHLAMLAAIKAYRTGACERIVLTRPAVGVDDEKHGFLPGDLIAKMQPWTRPLLDVLREFYRPKDIMQMFEDETIEIAPLAFMRGRTFKDAWIVADEMQNSSASQTKMLLTRIGEGSKIVITGDVEQTDHKQGNNGLVDLCERLTKQGVAGMSVCKLGTKDIQRHPIIDGILKLYSE